MIINKNAAVVNRKNLSMSELVRLLCLENTIVSVIDNGNYIGGVSVGDVRRAIYNGIDDKDCEKNINKNMTTIMYNDEEQVLADAKKYLE